MEGAARQKAVRLVNTKVIWRGSKRQRPWQMRGSERMEPAMRIATWLEIQLVLYA